MALVSEEQSKLVASLLKKNPQLLKDNKPVKIKISSKDDSGRSTTQVSWLSTRGLMKELYRNEGATTPLFRLPSANTTSQPPLNLLTNAYRYDSPF